MKLCAMFVFKVVFGWYRVRVRIKVKVRVRVRVRVRGKRSEIKDGSFEEYVSIQ